MVLFCPSCANLLIIQDSTGVAHFKCKTCPYKYKIQERVVRRIEIPKKTKLGDDVWTEEMENFGAKTATSCPNCAHTQAYVVTVQTRSGDEAETCFYTCAEAECRHRWREQ